MPKAPEPSSTCQKTTKSLPRISPKSYCYNAVPNRFSSRFSTSRTNGPRLLSLVKADTLAFANRIAHSGLHAETGASPTGALSLPSERSARSRTSPGRVSERRTLPLLGLGRVYSRRTQKAYGTAMCLCASLSRRRRGPAGLRDLFCFCRNCGLYTLRSELSVRARQGWYHYPRCALHVLETLDGRLSKGLICRFLRSGGRSPPYDSYFLANTQNFMSADPVANTFALWYNKSKELEEFQNNYAVKFPFAIASSSPGPRPKQQKGSAIP